jgi:parvulin-like peptidyl-prolyl isomerase
MLLPLSAKGDEATPRMEDITINGKPIPAKVATVNGVPLSGDLIKREMMAYKMMAARTGKTLEPGSEDKIARQVLGQEIDLELMVQKAHKLNIETDPKVVEAEIDKIRQQFPSAAIFESAMMFQGLTLEGLREKITRHLMVEEFLRREIVPKVQVGDKEARSYYDQNKKTFTQPPMYEVSHVFVATIDPSKEGNPENEEDKKKAQAMIKGINIEALEKIGRANLDLEAGKSFAEVVQKYSEDDASKAKGGILGTLLPRTTIPEIAEVMVRLKPGQTSGIIKSDFGYHIVKLVDIIPSRLLPFAEVQTDILNLLLKMQTENLKREAVKEMRKTAKIETFL